MDEAGRPRADARVPSMAADRYYTVLYVIEDIAATPDDPRAVPDGGVRRRPPRPVPTGAGATMRVAVATARNPIPMKTRSASTWSPASAGPNSGRATARREPAIRRPIAGDEFVTENHGASAAPKPCNTIFDSSGHVNFGNINGSDSKGVRLFGGVPAVSADRLAEHLPLPDSPWCPTMGQFDLHDTAATTRTWQDICAKTVGDRRHTATVSPHRGGRLRLQAADPHCEARAPSWSLRRQDGRSPVARAMTAVMRPSCTARRSGTVRQVTDPKLGGQDAKFVHGG